MPRKDRPRSGILWPTRFCWNRSMWYFKLANRGVDPLLGAWLLLSLCSWQQCQKGAYLELVEVLLDSYLVCRVKTWSCSELTPSFCGVGGYIQHTIISVWTCTDIFEKMCIDIQLVPRDSQAKMCSHWTKLPINLAAIGKSNKHLLQKIL